MRLFGNRSQMTSKCGKNKEVTHEPQASVSLMFLPHFDVFCDLFLNRSTAKIMESIITLFYTVIRILIHMSLPASYCLTVRGFVIVWAFLSPKCYFRSRLLFFIYMFFEKFFNVLLCSKQNNGENILQNSESLVAMTQLQFRHSQVVKNSSCFHFSNFSFFYLAPA